MRPGTLETKAMSLMFDIGSCYKSDLLLFLRSRGSDDTGNASRMLKRMIDSGYIQESSVYQQKGSETYKILKITRKGKNALYDTLGDIYFKTYSKESTKEFHTSSPALLHPRLADSRMKIFFATADVKATPRLKPSLFYLYKSLTDGSYEEEGKENRYRNDLSREECEVLLDDGLFYTIREVRSFLDMDSPGDSDVTYASRARGIFISRKNFYVIYMPRHGDNKLIRFATGAEEKLLKALRPLIRLTEATRRLPELEAVAAGAHTGEQVALHQVFNTVNALVISDGDSMVYTMATGNPNGIIRGADLNEVKRAKEASAAANRKTVRNQWLTGDGSIYHRVFVTPFTINGASSLMYLCSKTAEDWARESALLLQSLDGFTANDYDPMYPADEIVQGRKIPSIFMPVFEVNELYRISQMDYKVTILSYSDMFNAIAKSVRKDLHYYDADTLSKVEENAVMVYAPNGLPAGKKMIIDALSECGLQGDNKEIDSLHQRYGYDIIKFHNKIARGEIDIDKLIASLTTEPLQEVPEKRIIKKSVTVYGDDDFMKDLKQAAKYKNINMSAYIKNLIYEQVQEDARKYREKLSENAREWRKE